MRLTPAEQWTMPAGRVHTVRPTVTGPAPAPSPLSINQQNHLAAVGRGEQSVWLAFSCEVPAVVDAPLLERAAATLLERHSALQMSAVLGPDGPRGRRHAPGSVLFGRTGASAVTAATAVEATGQVRAHLDAACRPTEAKPAFGLASVVHAGGSTVVAGFDHLHVDAVSLPVLLRDLVAALAEAPQSARALSSLTVGDLRPAVPATRQVGCFATRAREWSEAEPVPADERRLRRWHDLLAHTGDRLPTFPFDLGVAPGDRAPQATTTVDLSDAATTSRLADAARLEHGTSTAAACLSAFATALRSWGAPSSLPMLVPVQTRTAEDEQAVGWFTTTVPVLVESDGDRCLPARAGRALSRGLEAAALPLDQVLASLPRPLIRERADVFMMSYVDYRRLPAHGLTRWLGACHVSAPTTSDDLQIWVARTDDGLHARVRAPRTSVADRLVPAVMQSWVGEIRALARAERPLAAAH